ncbi:hypothetical protein E8E11_011560 [Didymella keratinophila]|nr:hypothetical protein E8E11_011560 [Didymella keratinophila]
MSTSCGVASTAIEVQQDIAAGSIQDAVKGVVDREPISTLPPELLQSVLRHLPFFDLLRCQRVCQQWRAYLAGNDPTLQRQTFYKTPIVKPGGLSDIHLFITRQSWSQCSEAFQVGVIFHHLKPELGADTSPDIELHPMLQLFVEDVMRSYLGFAGMHVDFGHTIKDVQRECAWRDCCFTNQKLDLRR